MTFADLVATEINAMNRERVRQGKVADPHQWTDFDLALCRIMDKYTLVKPGVSGGIQRFSEPVESEDIEGLSL